MEKVIRTHRMRSEDGAVVEVDEVQEYIDASDKDGPAWLEGMKRLELSNGSRVNYIDPDTFEVVSTGAVLRRA